MLLSSQINFVCRELISEQTLEILTFKTTLDINPASQSTIIIAQEQCQSLPLYKTLQQTVKHMSSEPHKPDILQEGRKKCYVYQRIFEITKLKENNVRYMCKLQLCCCNYYCNEDKQFFFTFQIYRFSWK